MSSYPQREPFYAQKFIRILTKSAAAQELGPSLCWFLAVIACQEDAKRYREPANFYYEQLMPLCGFRSRKQLEAAITKAVQEGWLVYSPGRKGVPCKFHVSIPNAATFITSTPCDETEFSSDSEPQIDENQKCSSDLTPKTELKRDTKRNCKGITPIPSPIPIPKTHADEKSSESVFLKTKKPKTMAGFDEWYAIYPKHVDRGAAEKAYPKAIADIQTLNSLDTPQAVAELLRLTQERLPGMQAKEIKYQKHPASWLNAKGYRDEIASKRSDERDEYQDFTGRGQKRA